MTASPQCLRCETFPTAPQGPGTLFLNFPLSHSRAKILTYLRDSPYSYEQKGDALAIEVPEADLVPVVAPLMKLLSSTEQADVRVLFQKQGYLMQLDDYFGIESIHAFLGRAQSGWLIEMIEGDGLNTWFQPIVSCSDKSVRAYECLMRGSDAEGIVFPDRILSVARGANLLFQLDRAARLAAIRNASRHNLETNVFINFTPTSIYDPVNCLRSTVAAVDETQLERHQIVFEVIESDYVPDPDQLKSILDFYRASGFRVALDDVGSGYSSLNLLGAIRPDFIKLDRELIRDVHLDPYKATIAAKLLEVAQSLKVETVAEGVECEEEFHWLRDHGTDLVQGYYFARPNAIPPMRETVSV
ncbi:MAG TPA: EAL domain-containing protein [Abditibacteriaceae bacterium]|jgi:EAL domain-containing protein (putative c-di-GMP-specific phosphodiesterase class I)